MNFISWVIGWKLKSPSLVTNASFFQHALECSHDEIRVITGECMKFARHDNKGVIFTEEMQ